VGWKGWRWSRRTKASHHAWWTLDRKKWGRWAHHLPSPHKNPFRVSKLAEEKIDIQRILGCQSLAYSNTNRTKRGIPFDEKWDVKMGPLDRWRNFEFMCKGVQKA
jgi:hypothetical protein